MKDPTNGDRPHGGLQAGQIKLDSAEIPSVGGKVDVSENVEAIDLECERCLRDLGRCDGVVPICGRCAALRSTHCQWPSADLPRARLRMSDRLRRVPSSTPPSPRYAKSATPKGLVPSQNTGWTDLAPSIDNPGRLEPYSDLVQTDVTSHNDSNQVKDLVFSDVLPTTTIEDEANAQHRASPKPPRTMKYLDLCNSDPTTASPSPKKCRHCTTSGSKCDGERPCHSCVKYRRHCYDNNPKSSKRRPGSALKMPSNAQTAVEEKQSTSEAAANQRRAQEENAPAHSPESWPIEPSIVEPVHPSVGKSLNLHPAKTPVAASPTSKRTTKVYMVNADASDTRRVFCKQCISCHSTCDASLPCDRCLIRGIGHLCSYSERHVPAASGSNESKGASTDFGDPAASRTAAVIPAHGLSGVRRARVKNADPKETRMVFCNGCAKCHIRCDAVSLLQSYPSRWSIEHIRSS
jgi:hypothetical protein